MKTDGQRVIGKDLIEDSTLTQTRILNFIPEGDEILNDVFGVKLSDIPTRKNAIAGEPDLISCKINFTINQKENKIKFNSLVFGVDVYGENPYTEINVDLLSHWLPMSKIGFKKYEVNTNLLSADYPNNTIVDELKKIVYKSAR
jgi:hypothetical protein